MVSLTRPFQKDTFPNIERAGEGYLESFPDQKLDSGHHGDSWTNKLAKRDNRVSPLISPLDHADKASAGSLIG